MYREYPGGCVSSTTGWHSRQHCSIHIVVLLDNISCLSYSYRNSGLSYPPQACTWQHEGKATRRGLSGCHAHTWRLCTDSPSPHLGVFLVCKSILFIFSTDITMTGRNNVSVGFAACPCNSYEWHRRYGTPFSLGMEICRSSNRTM